jgi:hypothetical protein
MKRADMTPLYRSPNGDSWFLARDPETGLAFVKHQANASSGGRVTEIEIGAFLSGPRNPEQDALMRLVGTLIRNPQGADDGSSEAEIRREWSDAELNELGDMLLRGLSIEEIAGLLRRNHHEIRDKIAEVSRACR